MNKKDYSKFCRTIFNLFPLSCDIVTVFDVMQFNLPFYRVPHFFPGTLIPKACVEALIEALSSDAEKTEEKTF